ncbi:MAG TPA: calcium-binding EGF-like domain-containing protein [Enhygromyxa sp.]|nr:calcium-binding EGF-like domain-containing protein [Enhygromyxa sp.]
MASTLLVACNGDDGGGDDFNSGFTTLETSGDGDGDSGDGDGDSGDGDGSPGDGDGSPGDGDGDGDDPCAGVDCSGHGSCVDTSGTLSCACDDGYVAIGLECVSCPVASGTLDIDIPMITVSGNKQINGQSVQASNSGYMYFINRETGDSVSLGTLYSTAYSVNMIPGVYDLKYDEANDADGVPDNSGAIVIEGITLQSSGNLDINVPMITVSGNKTVNGQSVMASNSGSLYFINQLTGDSVDLGTMYSTNYSVHMIPGTYDLRYREQNEADGVPDNSGAIIATYISLEASGNYNIDIPTITVSGNKTINGQAVQASNSGSLYFINQLTGDAVDLGTMYSTNYSVQMIPGTYDLRYREQNDADGVPDNYGAIVATNISLDASGNYNIDIPMVTISGSKSINGQFVQASNSGYMYFINQLTGDSVGLGTFYTASYSVDLIPGTYDISYDLANDAPGVPENTRAIFETGIALQSSGAFDIDIPMVTLAGDRTINGQHVMASNSGYTYLINRTTGDAVSLGTLYSTTYSVQMIPGVYEIRYRESNDAPGIPENYGAILGCVQVQ